MTKAAKPYTFNQLTTGSYYFRCIGNQLLLGVAATPDKWLQAIYSFPNENTLFQLIPGDHETVQLYSVYHRSVVSAVGQGWALFPTVRDISWSRFVLEIDAARGTVRFRSTQPIAQNTPYVQIIGEKRIARIAMAKPDYYYGDFEVRSAEDHLHRTASCIAKGTAAVAKRSKIAKR